MSSISVHQARSLIMQRIKLLLIVMIDQLEKHVMKEQQLLLRNILNQMELRHVTIQLHNKIVLQVITVLSELNSQLNSLVLLVLSQLQLT